MALGTSLEASSLHWAPSAKRERPHRLAVVVGGRPHPCGCRARTLVVEGIFWEVSDDCYFSGLFGGTWLVEESLFLCVFAQKCVSSDSVARALLTPCAMKRGLWRSCSECNLELCQAFLVFLTFYPGHGFSVCLL